MKARISIAKLRILQPVRWSAFFTALVVLAVLSAPSTLFAEQNWHATLGSESSNQGTQVIAFLPNELWIHAGDSITWTSASGDIHTATFFIANQPYVDFTVGCGTPGNPVYSPSGSTFDGSTCVTAPPLVKGQSFEVVFSKPGNYPLVCEVHTHMQGVIHVLPASAPLPHSQAFYDQEAAEQVSALLADSDAEGSQPGQNSSAGKLSVRLLSHKNGVAAGIGEMAATTGGFQSRSVVRFLKQSITVHVGDTVEWGNLDPAMPHTITFGPDPVNLSPSPNVTFDLDGAGHATITTLDPHIFSGVIIAAAQDQSGVPHSPPGNTLFRITFMRAGTFNYHCTFHDNLGMAGEVTVLP